MTARCGPLRQAWRRLCSNLAMISARCSERRLQGVVPRRISQFPHDSSRLRRTYRPPKPCTTEACRASPPLPGAINAGPLTSSNGRDRLSVPTVWKNRGG
jgi:hypothetical protein